MSKNVALKIARRLLIQARRAIKEDNPDAALELTLTASSFLQTAREIKQMNRELQDAMNDMALANMR